MSDNNSAHTVAKVKITSSCVIKISSVKDIGCGVENLATEGVAYKQVNYSTGRSVVGSKAWLSKQ